MTIDFSGSTGKTNEREFGLSFDVAHSSGSIKHSVSVVIPCLNEERFIYQLLKTLSAQYDEELLEIIVVDGISNDGTRGEINRFVVNYPHANVRVIDNPLRHIPVALNLGITNASGDLIVRMDAHSLPSPNYIRRCVSVLSRSDAAVVGMPWKIEPASTTKAARAIALAVSHPFGIGDAKYRLGVESHQSVDTVPFGAFKRTLWKGLGGFNENLLANEDYEFNYRVRKTGGRIILDGEAHSVYYARNTFSELARQYFRYGFWKAQMVKLFPVSLRLRQLVPPVFLLSFLLLIALTPFSLLARIFLTVAMGSYVLLAILSAWQLTSRAQTRKLMLPLFFTFPVIHFSWGWGFLLGLFRSTRRSDE